MPVTTRLVSVSTVASFESVGAILVVGMIIVPAATAYLLTESLGKMIGISMAVGVVSSIAGYYIAYLLDASFAGSMISVAGGIFFLVFLLSPKHGVLAKNWARGKVVSELHAGKQEY